MTFLGAFMTVATISASCYFSSVKPDRSKYQVWGVDVSNYQGLIDWHKLEEQDVSFAFIKATEGSGHVDESARRNLEKIAETGIKKSAYHFFSFDSSGEIEYYADKKSNKPDKKDAEKILRPLLENLEEYYGVKPIIYATFPVYLRYVRENFSDYPLWIRNVNIEPDLMDWKFWQYCDKGELYGYSGEEKYIDLNVYNGTVEQFLAEFP